MEEEKLMRVIKFDSVPSPADFDSLAESTNFPAVICGCIKEWKACSNWNPSNGGLDYLQDRVGSVEVEAMVSRSAPVFYGDLRSHDRVRLPFSDFIGVCKQLVQNKSDDKSETVTSDDGQEQIYLAQVPIMSNEKEEKAQLEILKEDIQIPDFLERRNSLSSINLWMNSTQARSSTHYDPHHNLLCVVTGCKQVILWPPSASPMLYPMPIYGEASNHSLVALEKPDFSLCPRAEQSIKNSLKVILHAGDALFIPEGWFHQIDSDDVTIAVNFWWPSNVMCSLFEHMDSYYLRRILRRLTDKEMNLVLDKDSSGAEQKPKEGSHELSHDVKPDCMDTNEDQEGERNDLNGKEVDQKIMLHELEPCALQALHELVSLVHDGVKVVDPSHLAAGSSSHTKLTTKLFHLEDDPVAKTLWTLKPLTLQKVLLAMAQNFPRSLEALILHMLSPVGAEVLTRKFDEIDQQSSEENRNRFYQVFYGAFDDQSAAMDSILSGKELFAFQAFQNVLHKYVGVEVEKQGPVAIRR